jgi:hypothetical protein
MTVPWDMRKNSSNFDDIEHKNRMLRRIFGPKRDEDGSWRKLHNDKLHGLYSSPNIVRVIKSRRMGWTCGTHGGRERCLQGFCWEARRQETTGKT